MLGAAVDNNKYLLSFEGENKYYCSKSGRSCYRYVKQWLVFMVLVALNIGNKVKCGE